jgi:hypothetical protein
MSQLQKKKKKMKYKYLKRGEHTNPALGDEKLFGGEWIPLSTGYNVVVTTWDEKCYRRPIKLPTSEMFAKAFAKWEHSHQHITASEACFIAGIKWAIKHFKNNN